MLIGDEEDRVVVWIRTWAGSFRGRRQPGQEMLMGVWRLARDGEDSDGTVLLLNGVWPALGTTLVKTKKERVFVSNGSWPSADTEYFLRRRDDDDEMLPDGVLPDGSCTCKLASEASRVAGGLILLRPYT